MSSKAERSKDVEIMNPDPDEEEIGERITSSRIDLPGVSSKDLSDFRTDYDRQESGNSILEGHESWILEERKKHFQFQESETWGSPKKKTEEPKGIKGTFENITRLQQGEQTTSSSPSLPPGVSSKILSNSPTDDRHERVNLILEDYESRVHEERNKHLQFQKSEIRGSSEKKTEEEPKRIKGTFENIKRLQQGEQITSSSPSVPLGISSQGLSNFLMDYDRHEVGNLSLEDYVKQQQTNFWVLEEKNKHFQFQKSETRELSKDKTEEELNGIEGAFQNIERLQQEGLWLQELLSDNFQKLGVASIPSETKIDEDQEASVRNVYRTYFTASDEEDEEAEDVIFKLKISDTNCHLIPFEIASNHFTSQTLQLRDHLDRDWEVTLDYDDKTHSYLITKSLTPYLKLYHLNPSDIIQICRPLSQLHPDHFDIQYQKKLGNPLFEVEVPQSSRLLIPYDLAAEYFNPSKASLPPDHFREYPLHLTDHLNQTWEMRFVCLENEKAYAVVSGWEEYVDEYRLEHKDTIRIFRQDTSSEENSFIIYHKFDLSSI